jgi:hypothetical protein
MRIDRSFDTAIDNTPGWPLVVILPSADSTPSVESISVYAAVAP